MATSYTSLLGFALPVTGELSGNWGQTINDSITELVEDSIAGTATASVTSGDWTLTTTGSGASNEARCAIIRPTGTPGVSRNVIAPGSSKAYIVDNQSNAAIVFKASATTGVTIAAGKQALVAWNGSDFVQVGASAGGSNTQIQFNDNGALGGSANFTWDGSNVQIGAQGDLRFADSDSSNYVALQAPATVSTNVTFTLPSADGTNGQILSTNGSGVLSFTNAASGDVTTTGTQTLTNKTLSDPLLRLNSSEGTAGQVPVSQGAGLPPVWGSVSQAEIKTPTNATPSNASTDVVETPTLTGSTYYSLYGVTMAAAQWQVSTSSGFGTTVVSTGDVAGTSVSYTVSAGVLSVNTTYYWRVRYKDSNGIYSDWSSPTSFTTATQFNNFIATPASTPSNFGDSFEGGFYAGLIWNQVTQSSTSTTIGTGSKTFTVTDAAPLFYSGQTVEVRSRANPSTNRMIGTVTASSGTSLTVNVTSVDGSGTYTDWSVMAKYRVIVAPKSSGENASRAWKNANTAGPSGVGTLSEGWKATQAMVAADTSTVYPAAHWCNDLTINSYTDWYLPARDELELCWRNLKPVTNNNYTTADRPTGATPDYKNLGSLGDTSASHGVNNNSSPQGAAYTTTVPGQTAATAFRTGGAEAFEFGSAYYWSSTEYSASSAWYQRWDTSSPGRQLSYGKDVTSRVRAVRRSII